MTALGLAYYGGTLGLYDRGPDEWARALAFQQDQEERQRKAAEERERELERWRRRHGR